MSTLSGLGQQPQTTPYRPTARNYKLTPKTYMEQVTTRGWTHNHLEGRAELLRSLGEGSEKAGAGDFSELETQVLRT